jgi:asparagine N-glycosylation enzyme membrane subunit Stt3
MTSSSTLERLSLRLQNARIGWLAAPAIVAALLFAGALTREQIEAVWRTGAFFDSDDAMRAVQLRDFLSGQRWFDLVAHRLDPPTGQSMHWSRVVDVALALFDRFFALLFMPESAERATRLAFPAAMLALLLAFSYRLGALLSGAGAGLAAIWLVTLSGPMFLQFAPGRIDHHGPQIVALVAAFLFLSQGLDPSRARRLAIAAALMALSLSISLENLPLFLPMSAALLALFIVDGARARTQLTSFATGALVAVPALYVATVPGAGAFPSACDAFSFVHVAVFMVGALALLALAQASPRLTTPGARLLAALVAAAITAAGVLMIAPRCVGQPLGGIDPLIRDLWLSRVREATPLFTTAMVAPEAAFVVAAPVAMGLVAALYLSARATGLSRRRWLLAVATIAAGAAGGVWQMRVFTSVTPLAMISLAAAVVWGASRLEVMPPLRAAAAAAILFLVSPIGLAFLLAPEGAPADPGEAVCFTPEAMAPLAKMPPARVVSSFNLGPFILAQTPHSVFAAPYHRNNHGNRVAVDILLAPPDKAEALARAAGVDLIAWCSQGTAAPGSLAEAAPGGLAAMLDRGAAPTWLEKKSAAGDPLLVFAVRRVE